MNETILLTGTTGDIGSHLPKTLVFQGHNLIIFKRTSSSLERIEPITSRVIFCNAEHLEYLVPFNAHGKR